MAETMLRRFRRFVKLNERTLITVLLVILAPTFAFSFIMVDVLQDRSRGTFVWIGDARIRHADWLVALGKQRLVNKALWGFEYNVAEANVEQVLENLVFRQEADRLNIRVPQSEFERRVKEIYRAWAAHEKVKDLPPQERRAAMRDEFERTKWDPAEYARLVGRIFPDSPIGEVEAALREWMRVQKLQEEVLASVYVSDKEAYESWKGENEERTIAFYRMRLDDPEVLDQARREVTDEEIAERYEKRKGEYRSFPRIRFAYAKAPLSAWDGAVSLSEEDLRQAYERDRSWRMDYRRPAVIEPILYDVLTPEERKAAEESQYIPFEEVREKIAESQRALKRQQAASAFIRGILEEIRKATGAPEASKGEGEEKAEEAKADETGAPEKAPVDLEAIAARHPELAYGVTPWFSQAEAQAALGELYAPIIAGWFRSIERSADGKVGGRWPRQVTGKEVVCIALEPEVEPSRPLDLDGGKEIVRDELAKERAGSAAEALARRTVEALRQGKLSFEESAGTRPIHRAQRLKRRGPLKVEGLDLPEGSAARILDAAFAEPPESKIAEPAVEDDGGRAIVRIEEVVPPNPDAFTDAVKTSTIQRLRAERQRARYQDWRAEVMARYPIRRPGMSPTKEPGEAAS